MKVSEIVVGGQYEGKTGNPRDVMAEGLQFVMHCRQDDRDCVQWGAKNGQFGKCTRKAFAAWARKRIGTIKIEELAP